MGDISGEMKTILITGAGGYLGRYTVAAARARGHTVRALVRRAESAPEGWEADKGVVTIVADLNGPQGDLQAALTGVNRVIHIAANLLGNEADHARDTVAATRALYDAIDTQLVVLAGSMSVYQGRNGLIDEESALEPNPEDRDAYMRAKLAQEAIATAAAERGISSRILRLGAIFGPGRVWNGHIGVTLGPVLVLLAGKGALPLCFAPHAAAALVRAAEGSQPAGSVEILNIVDDNLPDARGYLAAIAPQNQPRFRVAMPWQALRPFARLARILRLPAPGLLRFATLSYRMEPRQYANARAKAALGWTPATRLEIAVREGG